MITANQILKKLQEKVWGKDKPLAEAAGKSILKNELTYGEFLDEVGKNVPKKEKKPLEGKIKATKATVRKPKAKQKITTQRKTG